MCVYGVAQAAAVFLDDNVVDVEEVLDDNSAAAAAAAAAIDAQLSLADTYAPARKRCSTSTDVCVVFCI